MNRCPVHIGEGGAYGCPVFRIFGDQETDAIHFFQLMEDLLALGQLRQVADQDEIKKLFPNTYGMPVVTFEKSNEKKENSTIELVIQVGADEFKRRHRQGL